MNILRGLLLDNLGLKLVALLLALAVYFNVFTERPATMVVSFPLEYTDLADSLALSGPAPNAVKAEVRGTGKQFIRIWLTEPHMKVSLAGVRPGRFRRQITPDDLPFMPADHITIERLVSPDSLDLHVERAVQRHLPVAPRIAGLARQGWGWSGVALADPALVLVRGPHRAVVALDSVRLAVVHIDGRRDTVRSRVGPDSLPDGCTIEPSTVMVSAPLIRY
jgi:hypothetical protein